MHVLSVLTLASMALAAPANTKRAEPAALLTPRGTNTRIIPGKNIVRMKDGVDASEIAKVYNAKHTFNSHESFSGFAGALDDKALSEIRDDPDASTIGLIYSYVLALE